jgi:hypothetical protein
MSQREYAFAADVLRVAAVYAIGGIYLDVDTEPLREITDLHLDSFAAVFRHHRDHDLTLSSDFIGMTAGHPLGACLLESMRAPAYDFGPHWLGYTVRSFFELARDAGHAQLRAAFNTECMRYMPSDEGDAERLQDVSWTKYFANHALFSWHPDNVKKFASGDYE